MAYILNSSLPFDPAEIGLKVKSILFVQITRFIMCYYQSKLTPAHGDPALNNQATAWQFFLMILLYLAPCGKPC